MLGCGPKRNDMLIHKAGCDYFLALRTVYKRCAFENLIDKGTSFLLPVFHFVYGRGLGLLAKIKTPTLSVEERLIKNYQIPKCFTGSHLGMEFGPLEYDSSSEGGDLHWGVACLRMLPARLRSRPAHARWWKIGRRRPRQRRNS